VAWYEHGDARDAQLWIDKSGVARMSEPGGHRRQAAGGRSLAIASTQELHRCVLTTMVGATLQPRGLGSVRLSASVDELRATSRPTTQGLSIVYRGWG
jgi:hypothetical protein